MRIKGVRSLLVLGFVMLVVACGGSPPVSRQTPTPPATATPSPATTPVTTPAPTPATGPVQATLSGADLATVTSVFISSVDSVPGRADAFQLGSILVQQSSAVLMPDGGEWAYVNFIASPTATLQDQQILESGTNDGVFLRVSPDSTWLLRGVVGRGAPTCYSMVAIGVPPAVAAFWGITEPCSQ